MGASIHQSLTADATRQAASCSFCHAFPTMMDCILELLLKQIPFPLSCFSGVFYYSHRRRRRTPS